MVESLAKLLHGIAASASNVFGQEACGVLKLMPAPHVIKHMP